MSIFLQRAEPLVELGLAVFPLQPGSKIPYPKTNGVKEATKDPRQIAAWSKRWPDANVGIACGKVSGIFVIDVDPRHGGDVHMTKLAAKGRSLPKGPLALTGNGGFHHFLQYEDGVKNGVNVFRDKPGQQTGVDIRSNGGYVVGPGSLLAPSDSGPGGEYLWKRLAALPCSPVWVTALLRPIKRPDHKINHTVPISGGSGGLMGWLQSRPVGERNTGLYWAANRMREQVEKEVASRTAVEGQLMRVAMGLGIPADEASKTIASGLNNTSSEGKTT